MQSDVPRFGFPRTFFVEITSVIDGAARADWQFLFQFDCVFSNHGALRRSLLHFSEKRFKIFHSVKSYVKNFRAHVYLIADKGILMLNSMAPVGMGAGYRFYLCNGRPNKHHSAEPTLTNYRTRPSTPNPLTSWIRGALRAAQIS